MSVTAAEYAEFRRKLGGSETSMPDAYIDALFEQAESDYDGQDRRIIRAAAWLAASEELLANAASDVDYTANASSEKLSQRFNQLEKMVKRFESALAAAQQKYGSSVTWGIIRKIPTRNKEYPDS
jgi:prophage DNA circulation protein